MTCIKALGKVQGSLAEARGVVGAITTSANGYVPIPMARAYGSIVCTIEGASYLRVTPAEVQWITDTSSAIYEVSSNIEWHIE